MLVGGIAMIQGLTERLKTLRHQNGYSQRRVAELIKVAPSAVAAYETGERTPSIDKLIALATLYHVSVDFLLGVEKTDMSKLIDVSNLTDEQIQERIKEANHILNVITRFHFKQTRTERISFWRYAV